MKYRKVPVVIEAYKYEGDGLDALNWAASVANGEDTPLLVRPGYGLFIKTLEGEMHVSDGDFIIQGILGEFYPCKPDIFEKTYEKVDEQN